MTIHQELVNWFKKCNLTVLPEEREQVKKNFLSGYECDYSDICPLMHMFVALIITGKNPNLADELEKTKPVNIIHNITKISSDEWTHLMDLVNKWTMK